MSRAGMLQEEFAGKFGARFGARPAVFRAPGRVNIIGEHTDYNDGFVMPIAIGFHTFVAVAAREDGRWRVHSDNLDETVEFSFAGEAFVPPAGIAAGRHWSEYASGVVRALRERGIAPPGADLLVRGEVPLGAGLSSSASLEVALALAVVHVTGARLEGLDLALACQRAENEFVGTRCGIMDQYASVHGRAGHALLLDCRSLRHRAVPLAAPGARPARLLVCNSGVRHALAGGEYNLRREECERAVALLRARVPGLASLRDVTATMLAEHGAALDDTALRRARHVVTENARAQAAAGALEAGDFEALGRLMMDSHQSLRDDYGVSCEELDLLVELASQVDGVLGSRMTGGGFGGCTIHLVRPEAADRLARHLRERYRDPGGKEPSIHFVDAVAGAGPVQA